MKLHYIIKIHFGCSQPKKEKSSISNTPSNDMSMSQTMSLALLLTCLPTIVASTKGLGFPALVKLTSSRNN